MSTITICVDDDGRVTALLVPEGAVAQVVGEAGVERFYGYDAANDVGLRDDVPRRYRSRQGVTSHEIGPAAS